MLPHSRLWWFVLIAVVFLLLATALGRSETQTTPVAPSPAAPAVAPPAPGQAPPTEVAPPAKPAPAPTPTVVPREPEKSPFAKPAAVLPEPSARAAFLIALALHVVATVIALRIGMKIFYESALFGGFCMIVLLDALVLAALLLAAPLTDGFTALLGPQVVVTALAMMLTLHHYGFSKERFTVIPTVLATKAFGFFAEVALRMLFLEALTRFATEKGI